MTDLQQGQLEQYRQLVLKYSSTLDLSSPTKLKNFSVAIENSSAYAKIVPEHAKVIDIGSGVGLPGVPLAILRPDIQIVLCEIRQKRAAFLERIISTLHITNASVYNGDVQQIQNATFDAVTAQAVGTLKHIYKLCSKLLGSEWVIITTKGEKLTEELAELQKITPIRGYELEKLDENTAMIVIKGGHA
jgi:16S rRNA (guanine527-N7)-methyltransferase